jgi:serine/threonine protein kinase
VAPEVIRTTKYDIKADIYSLGIIAEELFLLNSQM